MSGLKQVCACWDMSWGVTYAASVQCDPNCQSDSMSSEPVCEVSKKLLDLEQRLVVKFLTKDGKKPKEILERMVVVMGSLPLLTTKWNFGVSNLSGEESRLKVTLTLGVLWKRLLKKCARNWKVWFWQIGEWRCRDSGRDRHLSRSSLDHYSQNLDMSKVSARWVPRMLIPFQKDTRRQCCQENLKLLTEDPEHFFSTFGDRRRDLGIPQRSWVQNGVHAVEAQDFPHP